MSNKAEIVVVGAGLNGLSTAWQLTQMGCKGVTLLERFPFGHNRGSSHGLSRITRSVYADPLFLEWMQLANREHWPALERASGTTLRHPRTCLMFGPETGPFREYAETVSDVSDQIEPLSLHEMRRRFPMMSFSPDEEGLLDHTGGVIAARETLEALTGLCQQAGVEMRDNVEWKSWKETSSGIQLETSAGSWECSRVVLTTGTWLPSLVQTLDVPLQVVWQTVVHMELCRQGSPVSLQDFPIWAWIQAAEPNLIYGFPELHPTWMKTARHLTSGPDASPVLEEATADHESERFLIEWVSTHFPGYEARVASTERCVYTMTPDEHFVLQTHPSSDRIVIGGGFSGHGFKFGPLTGRILAELALWGECRIPEFRRWETSRNP